VRLHAIRARVFALARARAVVDGVAARRIMTRMAKKVTKR